MQLTTGNGGYAKTLHNIVLVLMNDPNWQREVDGGETRSIIAYDEFACTTVFIGDPPWEDFYLPAESQGLVQPHAANRRNLRAAKHFAGKEIDDRDAGRAAVWLERNYPGLSPSTGMVLEAFEIVAETQKVHPVREYLHSLKWDGQRRVGTVGSKDDPGAPSWLSTLMGAKDSAYVRTVGRWWLISAVARIMSPGEQVDSLIILEGAQGAGKSQGLRALAEPWFSEDLGNIQDTASAQQQIQGVWIIEIAELDAINRAALEAVKKFITQPYDRFRAPYGRRVRQ
jgi:putative DNA primase/helicase